MALLIHRVCLWVGILVYRYTGVTPAVSYQSMIRLFCITGGETNRNLAKQLSRPKVLFPDDGILPIASTEAFKTSLAILEEQGFIKYPALIPHAACDAITSHLLRCRGNYAADTIRPAALAANYYDRGHPLAAKFDISTIDLFACEDVQRFVCDHSLLALAQAYLDSGPVIDIVAAWWSTSTEYGPDSTAAQLFHFDMDRPRWLKAFLYLTDVPTTSGPHVFIPTTHRDRGIPRELLQRGYRRLSDEDVARAFPKASWIEATGPKGTVIIEDTRGLHKGKQLQFGDRLVLQIEYASSLFGASRPVIRYPERGAAILEQNIERFPTVFEAFAKSSDSSLT